LNEQAKKHECYLIKNKKNNFSYFSKSLNKKIKIIDISNFFSFFIINYLINLIKPNIVHTHLGNASKKIIKRDFFKLISTIHMNFKLKYYKNHDGLIVSNNSQKKEIKKTFQNKIKRIYLWPSTNECEKVNSLQLRKYYKIPENSFIFGSIGRFHHQKGFDIIIKAFEKIEMENIFLFLIGNNHFQFKKYQNKKTIILPFQKNTKNFYNIFDCFLNASRWETFGFTLVETMQYQLPIISTKHMGNQD